MTHRPVAKGRGEIQLIIGPMFSGKSTELLRRLRRCQFAMLRCLMIKYEKDERYDSDMFSTHDGTKVKAAKCQKLEQIEAVTAEYDVIGIDEGQFFSGHCRLFRKSGEQRKNCYHRRAGRDVPSNALSKVS